MQARLDVQRGLLRADVLPQRRGLLPAKGGEVGIQVVLPANVVKSLAVADEVHHLHCMRHSSEAVLGNLTCNALSGRVCTLP